MAEWLIVMLVFLILWHLNENLALAAVLIASAVAVTLAAVSILQAALSFHY